MKRRETTQWTRRNRDARKYRMKRGRECGDSASASLFSGMYRDNAHHRADTGNMCRILVTFRLTAQNECDLLEDNVIYRPDLPHKNDGCWKRAISASKAKILIVRREDVHRLRWPVSKRDGCIVVVLDQPGEEFLRHATARVLPDAVYASGASQVDAERNAFMLAERQHARTLTSDTAPPAPAVLPRRRNVVMIGSGVVNLVTALELVERDYGVTVYDKCPPPHQAGSDWREFGATFGGRDGRIFSLNESRHHNARGFSYQEAGNTQFQRSIADGGWLARSASTLTTRETAWIEMFERVPPWLATHYDADIIGFNKDSHQWWLKMQDDHSQLFESSGFREPLYRVYQTGEKLRKAREKERDLGAVLADLGVDGILDELPALSDSVRSNRISGGLKVVGFSVNVHLFANALIRLLEARGATFHWRRRLESVLHGTDGRVLGVELDGERMEASDYVVSPGAYGDRINGIKDLQRQVGTVMGMWITLPNCPPRLEVPLKVTRSGFGSDSVAEGANVIPGIGRDGRHVIHCSSGHGFLGLDPSRAESAATRDLVRCVGETAASLFPAKYKQAKTEGVLDERPQYCVRPWTASGLGLFDVRPTGQGGCFIYTGGHNTGGFAQSPSVARAVAAALAGKSHPMHEHYHPERCSTFLSIGA